MLLRDPVPARGRELAQLILEECERSGLTVGARLPTEREFAAQLGVGRSAVRLALGLLEADGRVSREIGRGTFLCEIADDASPAPPADSTPVDAGPTDVMVARQALEPQIVPLVVAHATGRDFDEFERCLDGGAAAETPEEFEAWDVALHHAIVAASRNPLLVRLYAEIEAVRGGQVWGTLKRRNDTHERRAAYQREHEAIVEALRAREPDRALEAMRTHLEHVRANLLRAAEGY